MHRIQFRSSFINYKYHRLSLSIPHLMGSIVCLRKIINDFFSFFPIEQFSFKIIFIYGDKPLKPSKAARNGS